MTLQKYHGHVGNNFHWEDVFSQDSIITLDDIKIASTPGYSEAIRAASY